MYVYCHGTYVYALNFTLKLSISYKISQTKVYTLSEILVCSYNLHEINMAFSYSTYVYTMFVMCPKNP